MSIRPSKKQKFILDFEEANFGIISHMVIAVRLPSGAVEIIVNTDKIEDKFNYYVESYDDSMCLNTNKEVKIKNWMFVG